MHTFLIVAVTLLAFSFVRRHAWHRAWAHGRCGPRGWHRHHHGEHGPRGWRNSLFVRLDLTPAQERELRGVADALRAAFAPLRDEASRSRADLADALRADAFEDSVLDDMYARHDERLAVLRVDLNAAVGRVHELLDARQRERLADLLASGKGPWSGPYR